MDLPGRHQRTTRAAGFTLAEVVVSLAIMTLVFGGIIASHIQNAYRAEWTGYSLAAHAQACQQLERAKCAVWDIQQTGMNQIILMTNKTSDILDLPVSGTNSVWVTNTLTITNIPLTGSVSVYMVKVESVWPFRWGGRQRYYTNTVASYFGPD